LVQVGALRTRALTISALLLILSCKPGPGSACDTGEMRCLDAQRSIVCEGGKFVEMPCKGKAGCSTFEETTSCDISGNQPGDACAKDDEGVAVCAGENAMLACRSRRFEAVPCRGSKGCELVAGRATCDQSIAEPGEACKKPDAKACSVDKLQVLSCHDGSMREQYACRGEAGCSAEGGKLLCDQTVAKLGDTCDKDLDGHVACSEDKKSLVICNGEKFVTSETCKPATRCVVSGRATSCAKAP
jgi:hypothetical protein